MSPHRRHRTRLAGLLATTLAAVSVGIAAALATTGAELAGVAVPALGLLAAGTSLLGLRRLRA
jgi:hypothetical protein